MRWLVDLSLKFGVLMGAVAAGILVLGLTQLGGMRVDVLPEFAPPFVEVQTEALGLSAQEVEQLVTVPLEQDLLNGVPWLAEIRSESLPGLSSIVMTFEPGTEPIRARQVVGERLTQAFALPHVSRPPTMLQPTSAANRVMMVGLSAQDLSLVDLSVLARWTIAPRLMGVPGVANVSIWGQRDRQLQVQVDPKQLAAKNVTLLQVLETTGNAMWVSSLSFVEASTPGTGGFIESANQRLGIRHVFPISSPDDLAKVPLEDARTLRLGDVATVVEDHQPLIGDAVSDTPSLLLVVEKAPLANTLEVSRGLDQAIAAMRPGLTGVDINASVYRADTFIEAAIGDLGRALLIGGLLLVFVLGVVSTNWRAGLVAAVAILVSLTTAALTLHFRGVGANRMIVAGFLAAIGLMVDDAILAVDADRGPASYTVLIAGLLVAPVLLIGGLTGAFVQAIATAYGLALLASMLVALLVTPALCTLLIGRTPARRADTPLTRWVGRAYDRALGRVVAAPRPALLGLVAVAVIGVALLPLVRTTPALAFKERDLLVHLNAAPGTARVEMDRIVGRMSAELRTIDGVKSVGAHVGRALLSDRIVNVDSAELWIGIDPGAAYEPTLDRIRSVIRGYPGLRQNMTTFLEDRVSTYSDKARPLTLRVFGENPEILRRTAADIQRQLASIDGLVGQHADLPPRQPTLEVEVNLPAAQRFGLKPGDVRRAAATVLSGLQVGSLFEEQKIFDVVVWGTPETRHSLTNIRELPLDTPSGRRVKLGDIAEVRVVPDLSVIRHQDVRGYVDINLDVRGRAVEAVASDAQQRVQGMQLPLEYHAEVLGNYSKDDTTRRTLLSVVGAAVIGIFLLFQAAFGSWRLAAFGVVSLPAAIVGGLLGVVLFSGGDLGLGGLAGLLAVFGIAARQLLNLFRSYQALERDSMQPRGVELVRRGSRDQLGTVLATGLGTAAVLAPFVVLGDAPGFEVVRPLAIVAVCGLLSVLAFNLFLAPAGYLVLATNRASQPAAAPASLPAVPAAPLVTAIGMALLFVAACGPAPRMATDASAGVDEPARVVPIAGTDQSRVILTQQSAERLDVQTDAVRAMDVGGEERLVVPYSAVIYDVNGDAWAYISQAPLTFVREKLNVASIDGDTAVLEDGPPVGTQVVTLGGAELYGAEFEFQEG